ncbi:sushi domain-containing protein 2-like [Saccostrea echinata]|uniref:sushi domain-containing protein 2-like n=1 Tax=Saccostrea echinata TaxID=191078 RepID=UPI002A806035|nr:sushi domain-containing protein 2-like [Saccostrea echinata]
MAVFYRRIFGLYLLFICLFHNLKSEVLFSQGNNEVQVNYPLTKIPLPDGLTYPYFGQNYKSLYVSKDGFVAFSEYARYVTSRKFTVRDEKSVNAAEDYPFVAPFYYGGAHLKSTLEGGNAYQGKIFYNVLKKGERGQRRELESIGRNITESIAGVRNFDPKFALVVTWVKVTDEYNTGVIKCTDGTGRKCQANTFQAVLVTDGILSFAIFNYKDMKLTFPPSTNYQAGFNGGYGRGWSPAISKQFMSNISMFQASSYKGRYIYQINEERIITGGCDNPDGKLQVVPDSAGMFGGEMVEVTGPCFKWGSSYSLSFGNRRDKSEDCLTEDYDPTTLKARCEIPILTESGQVTVFMKATNGQKEYNTTITIVLPSRMPTEERVQLVNQGPGSLWNDTSAASLYLQWNPRILSNHSNAKVSVNLRGYSEEKKSWDLTIPITKDPIPVSRGSYRFNTEDISCDERCQGYEVGVIEVKLEDPRMAIKYRVLRSRPTTLGWLVSRGMVARYGDSWPVEKCQAWYQKDIKDRSWLNFIPACPCNLQQALADIGRWYKDHGCNLFSKSPLNCALHSAAVHCVRSVQPNVHGAGNQCCYRADGTLIYSSDSYQGSTLDRAQVPSMSHWVHDIVPFFYCCMWTGFSADCDKYMAARPTLQCTGYSPPKQAMVFGQGNVRTFDNDSYFVCGEGDFILLESTPVTIEGRFQKSPFSQNYNSTILTDVGIRSGNDVIEIRMKGPNADRSKRILDVLVNGEYQFFDNGPLQWKDFTDSVIVNSDDPSNTKESNVTVITKNGIGVQVAENHQRLSLLVMIPPGYESSGLLGRWNNDSVDDLTPRNSKFSVLHRNPKDIYSKFVFSWAITKNKGTLSSTIVPFPVFATNKTDMCFEHSQEMTQCYGDKSCNHDYWTTMNMTLAYQTMHLSSRYDQIQDERRLVRSCGLLDVPQSIKDNYNYSLGNTVVITGCRRGELTGEKVYKCTATGEENSYTQSWTPEVTASCEGPPEQNITMIIGIVVAIVVVLIIVIVIAVILKKKRSGSMKGSGKKETSHDTQQYSVVAQKE